MTNSYCAYWVRVIDILYINNSRSCSQANHFPTYSQWITYPLLLDMTCKHSENVYVQYSDDARYITITSQDKWIAHKEVARSPPPSADPVAQFNIVSLAVSSLVLVTSLQYSLKDVWPTKHKKLGITKNQAPGSKSFTEPVLSQLYSSC